MASMESPPAIIIESRNPTRVFYGAIKTAGLRGDLTIMGGGFWSPSNVARIRGLPVVVSSRWRNPEYLQGDVIDTIDEIRLFLYPSAPKEMVDRLLRELKKVAREFRWKIVIERD